MTRSDNIYKKMAWDNLVFGLIGVAGVLISFFYFKKFEGLNIVLGFLYLFGSIVGLISQKLFYDLGDFKGFVDLHKALISSNIHRYDFGSKFLVYSYLLIQLFGIGLIIIGLIQR